MSTQDKSSSLNSDLTDLDPQETQEWVEALNNVIERHGLNRTEYIMNTLLRISNKKLAQINTVNTDFVNTISVDDEPKFPGDLEIEKKIENAIRWNAAIMVHRANRPGVEVGGHISTYAGVATMYEVGFNHFWKGKNDKSGGDHIYYQGHASPGIYSRAFLEHRLTDKNLEGFRQEKSNLTQGLSSYPHPRLMPQFWEFPTVSMGLGPLNAIYQAQLNKYLENRNLKNTSGQQVWAFLGDGEMDEPESRGLLQTAANDRLDNLNFVISCNMQRLDGPVRGNGKIIQELEAFFKGAKWNVIKVIWGSEWDNLLKKDKSGKMIQLMNETLDGDFQTYSTESGSFIRKNFFGRYQETYELVKDLSDDDILNLRRGGHDPKKIYAAYNAASKHIGQPTVILINNVKGFNMGPTFEGRNATHQMKKMTTTDIKRLRDNLDIPVTDSQIEVNNGWDTPFWGPEQSTTTMEYLHNRRRLLGGYLPNRNKEKKFDMLLPENHVYEVLNKVSNKKKIATTMMLVRLLKDLMRDKNFGKYIIPIIPDEGRTFGLDSLFSSEKVYNPNGQNYISVDRNNILKYKESHNGRIIHTGINEAGSIASFTAVGSAYSTHGLPLIPIYIFYSMFGFQRTGDGIWAAADQMTRGFLIGATAGKTTLAGEGLQHGDGHSLILAETNPAVKSYDPAFGYEISIIFKYGLEEMYGNHNKDRNKIYYITVYNEPITQIDKPANLRESDLIKGMYLLKKSNIQGPKVQLIASGIGVSWILESQKILAEEWGVSADIWSVTSWSELRRDGIRKINKYFDSSTNETPYVTQCFQNTEGPIIATSDWNKYLPDMIRQFVPRTYHVLGADDFGFSDTRSAARRFYKIDAHCAVVKALHLLEIEGSIPAGSAKKAYNLYEIDKINYESQARHK